MCCAIEKPFGRKCRQVKDENFVFVSPFGKCLNWPNSLAVKRYEASLSLFLFRTWSDKTNRFYVFYAVHLFTKRLPKTLMCHHFVPVPLIDLICNLLCTYHWTDARQHRIYLLKRPRHLNFQTRRLVSFQRFVYLVVNNKHWQFVTSVFGEFSPK